MTTDLTWADVQTEAKRLASRWQGRGITAVHGIPAGGAPVACLVAGHLGVPVVEMYDRDTLVVDDLVDSGATLAPLVAYHPHIDALYRKPDSPADLAPHARTLTGWLTFPWEHEGSPTDAVVRLIQWMGDDPTREGLRDTPKRVTKAWREVTEGYHLDPADVLSTTFDEPCDEMIVLSGIEFTSTCEHHLLPFTGTATVGYIPNGSVVGLSKLARLVDLYARRLQIQERLTQQIATTLQEHTGAQGVGVIVSAHHSCMSLRGIRKANTTMTTTALLGAMYDDPRARSEFLTYRET